MQFKDCNVTPREVHRTTKSRIRPIARPLWLTASLCSGAISAKVSVRGRIHSVHGFDNLNIRLPPSYISAHFQAVLSRRRRLPEWVQKWVRSNESLLNIKNKMASLSSIFPVGTAYKAGGAGLSREAKKPYVLA